MRPRPDLASVLAGLVLAGVLATASGGDAATPARNAAAGWQGVLGARPAPQIGGRWIVLFKTPSLADRVRDAGGRVGEEQLKKWTRLAARAQERLLARLASRGAPIVPEESYIRVVNGVAAPIDPRILRVLESQAAVAGVYPVRAAYPAAHRQREAAPGSDGVVAGVPGTAGVEIPGFDGSGVEVALLDTGVDLTHPFIRERLLPGTDIVDHGGDASARFSPTDRGRAERHGTELAGLLAGSRGPGDLHGVAPGALIRPIRVAGWQPDGSGGVSVYARTDQVLAGLEVAVDPNRDGDTHDAARVALVGVVDPFVAFPDDPLIRAAEGALALDTLVVAPTGNDGPAGPAFGSVGSPGASAAALAVAAVDTRSRGVSAPILLRAGMRVLLSGRRPLGGAGTSAEALDLQVVALPRRRASRVGGKSVLEQLFDRRGFSTVAGKAALLPPGPPIPEDLLDLARAGARAVLVDGPLPAGALGLDERRELPILGLEAVTALDVRRLLRQRVPVSLSVGTSRLARNPGRSTVAPFSAQGLIADGTRKPDLAAPGVALATSAPGRAEGGAARYGAVSGTSAAAAVAAGALALLAQARPDLDAAGLRSAIVTSGARLGLGSLTAVTLVSPQRAAAAEIVPDPPFLGLGSSAGPGSVLGVPLTLRNTSRRRITGTLETGSTPAGVQASVFPPRVSLRPGGVVHVGVSVSVSRLPAPPASLAGTVRLEIDQGATVRIGWSLAVPVRDAPLVSGAAIDPPSFPVSDATPAVLTLTAGRVDGAGARPQLLPLSTLQVELMIRGRVVGRLAGLRNVLPGRYAFAITGRGTLGGKLAPGNYALRVTGVAVSGGEPTAVDVPFTIEPRPAR